MTAATIPTSTTGHPQWIPLTKLSASPLNHRKRFDKTKMEELTDSVRAQGIVCPILARPLNGTEKFEIVAGERRYRAAKAAGLTDILAVVRDLTDAQALELQVIENGQREDVHPLEEAEGYEALMDCTKGDGTKYSADDIAAKVGKSKAYVYARLKLTALCKVARLAFFDGKLTASTALLVARIPGDGLQKQALEEITSDRHDGILSYRDAAAHIQRQYMLQLDKAPFPTGDADLLAKAGACTSCPKRSGNQPELFGDVKSADVCTDPECFESKRQAHVVLLVKVAQDKGQEVVTGKDAKKLLPDRHASLKGFQRLDDEVYTTNGYKKLKTVLGKDCPLPTLIENPHTGALMECVRDKDVADLLKTKMPRSSSSSSGNDKYRAEQRALERKQKLEREIRKAIYFAARDRVAAAGLGTEDVRLVVAAFWGRLWHDAKKVVAPFWIPDTKGDSKSKRKVDRLDALTKTIPAMSGEDLIRLLLDCAVAGELMYSGWAEDRATLLASFAQRHKVDAAKIRREFQAAAKAAAPTKIKSPKKAKVTRAKKGGKK